MNHVYLTRPNTPCSEDLDHVRIAAIGDLHMRETDDFRRFSDLESLCERADLLIVAGDLTESGRLAEAELAGELLAAARLPVIAVLGNHDLRSLRRVAFRRLLERKGVEVLEGRAALVRLDNGLQIGVAGTTGCGGGFWPVEGPHDLPGRTLKRFALHASREARALDLALRSFDADLAIAVMHFAPTTSTLGREPLAKYWMLGNCELGVVLDQRRPDLAIHGHAHRGNRFGFTPGGLPVRNVALPVVGGVHLEAFAVEPGTKRQAVSLAGLAS